MRLMIVDDHPGVRELIRQWVTTPEDVVCECGCGDEAVRVAPEFRPDAVAMDVRMPGICGFEAVRAILAGQPAARVVVVTTHDEPAFRRAAREAGAVAFFGKENLGGLRSALAGEGTAAPANRRPPAPGTEPDLDALPWWAGHTREMLAELELDGEVTQLSPSVRHLLGYEREELLGTNLLARVHPDDWPAAGELAAAVTTGRWVTGRCRHKDGSWRWFEARGEKQPATGAPGRIRLLAREVTDREEAIAARQRLQPELDRALQLEALGTWAGGMAHDFNNILAAIIAYADLARMETSGQPEAQGYLDQVLVASERGRELTRQILRFTRPAPLERKVARLQPVLEELFRRLRAALPAQVELTTDTRAETGPVRVDTAMIQQVLAGLCVDAVAALRGRPGRVGMVLAPCLATAEPGDKMPGLRAGPHARLTIQATGDGHRPAVPGEPLAAAVETIEETSLGLAAARRLAREHGGAVQVTRRPGGVRVELYFPLAGVEGSSDSLPVAPSELALAR